MDVLLKPSMFITCKLYKSLRPVKTVIFFTVHTKRTLHSTDTSMDELQTTPAESDVPSNVPALSKQPIGI